eukprot:gene5274-5940_t
MAARADDKITVVVKWSGKEFSFDDLSPSNTVSNLKEEIFKKTMVRPDRQKLLGLKYKGKPPNDEIKLQMLSLKPGFKIMMMGTAEETLTDIIKPPQDVLELKIADDQDVEEDEVAFENREEYLAKIEKRVSSYEIKVKNEPRVNKKLLVLDVDYTLFDHRSAAECGLDLMRPYLHEFLTSSYEHYDIVIWSATSMKWIEAKMQSVHENDPKKTTTVGTSNLQELGVTDSPNYKIMFILDSSAMITVHSQKYGIIETKPLGVIWGKYSQYSSKNSIMVDDLRRNFLMNPQNGLKIRPFRQAHVNRSKDQELLKLSQYLRKISVLEELSALDHRDWDR